MGTKEEAYTENKNLIQYAPSLTSGWVYQWRLLLEEYGTKIAYIRDVYITVTQSLELTMHHQPVKATEN